ncbi:alpha/beta hydrolase [Blastococcus brunescens]|uniref:Alpha/beta hydrolase n=1 Tax=Blastococcus brunescens TaxID=1564165 RepID=A0ABZ1B2D0_9ACTN|nr:alpha/beta hydrolase [Blastococcus sp. BMG 8361]WRL64977.1 alpha/beta hydrolase [Blastococcus sp. BMG 8361]
MLLLVLALITGLLWGFQRTLIYLPDDGPVGSAASALPGARDVVLRTADGLELGAGICRPARPMPPRCSSPTATVGTGDARAARTGALGRRAGGPAVRLPRLRRQPGQSDRGRPRPRRARRPAVPPRRRRASRAAPLRRGEPGRRRRHRARHRAPPAGLVLRSPFVDLASVAAVHYPVLPVRALLRDEFPVAEQIARVDVPTTVVYGNADTIVPPEQSRAVADAAAQLHRLVEVPGAHHNDAVLLDGDALVDAVVELA